MEFQELAAARYSVRSFRKEHLPTALLTEILSVGNLAPTGCNLRPQRILVLNTDHAMEKLDRCTKCRFGAPTALLICYDETEAWSRRKFDSASSGPIDAAIVTTHLMLAAHDRGVGTCWVMYFDPEAIRREFALPDHFVPLALLVMGYPAEDALPSEMHKTINPLDQTVFFESF